MRLALGRRDQGGELHRLDREWDKFCGASLFSVRLQGPRPYLLFQIMTMIFTTIGSAADYGSFGKWLLLVVTLICWAAQFASMSLTCR
jgi:hypothetical protein